MVYSFPLLPQPCCHCCSRNYQSTDVVYDEPLRLFHTAGSSSPLVKPDNDNLEYKFVLLENGLKALVISDPETDKAAAALDVNVGSLSDPEELSGLAHFTEHMLFYSSEKYPVEDEYSKFVSDHGGHTNAYTASENTNYQFDVNWDHLEPALDRFAQFFICPLISVDGVDRELKAVDSEHGKNLNSDAWRQLQLCKLHANQKHPWSRFATGNMETLSTEPRAKGIDVRQSVVDFHARHYSSNIMKLVVYGRQPVTELEAWVRRMFSAVPNSQLQVPQVSPHVFDSTQLPLMLQMVPQRTGHVLEISWQVPPSAPQYRSQPLSYLSHLLGHEGAGSVFAELKSRGWATSLVAGESGTSITSRSFFYVRVELTDDGQAHARKVGALVFRYLSLLRRPGGVAAAIFEECQSLHRLRFNYRDKMAPYQTATSLAAAMHQFPDSHLLTALYHVPEEFDPAAVHEALACLTPQAALVVWQSPQFAGATNGSEPWYGTAFNALPLPQDWAQDWAADVLDDSLHLPEPNPYIPTDFTLYTEPSSCVAEDLTTCTADMQPTTTIIAAPDAPPASLSELLAAARRQRAPELTVSRPLMKLHWLLDNQFKVPKAVWVLDFQSPQAYTCPEHAVMTRLFVKLVADYLNELAYPAELAGLSYSIVNTLSGFKVEVGGYNHKLRVLLQEILARVAAFKVVEERFAVMSESLTREYRNLAISQPYSWAMYRREGIMQSRRWHVSEYLEVLPGITPARLQQFHATLMDRLFVEGMAVGNVRRDEVAALAELLEEQLSSTAGTRPCFASQAKEWRTVALPQGSTALFSEAGPNPDNDNSAVVVVYQVGPDSAHRSALLALLTHLAKRDAFAVLRTQEQLGYVVWLFENHELTVKHVELVLQSNAHSAEYLAGRVEAFIQQWVGELEGRLAADPTLLTAAVEEVSKSLLERPKRLAELAARMWREIYYSTLRYQRAAEDVEELQTLTAADLLGFARTVLSQRDTRRKLCVHICGNKAAEGPASRTASVTGGPATAAMDTEDGVAAGTASHDSGGAAAVVADPSSACTADAAAVECGDVAVLSGSAVHKATPVPEVVQLIGDIPAFKRSCSLFPSASDVRAASSVAPRL